MPTISEVTSIVNNVIKEASSEDYYLLVPYVSDWHFRSQYSTGVYTSLHIRISFPYVDHNGMFWIGAKSYNMYFRIKGGLNYIYRLKVELDPADPFKGSADFDPELGKTIHRFEDDMRCYADELKKRGTLAFYK